MLSKNKHLTITMKKTKIILALISWIIYIYLYNAFILPSNTFIDSGSFPGIIENLNDWLLGMISTISVLAVICGGTGYIIYGYSNNKKKEQMFKKIFKYGSIILFFAGLTYSLTVSVIVDPVF